MITLNNNSLEKYNSIPDWRLDARDLYFEIKDSLTIADVLQKYTNVRPNRYKRVACPIHGGRNLNFSYTDRVYTCFKCEASGDVIQLAKELNNCDTRFQATKMLDADFNLGLFQNNTKSLQRHLELEQKRVQLQRERWLREQEELKFKRLMIMRDACDIIIKNSAPENEDDEFPDVFCKAIDFRTRIEAQLQDYIEEHLTC